MIFKEIVQFSSILLSFILRPKTNPPQKRTWFQQLTTQLSQTSSLSYTNFVH